MTLKLNRMIRNQKGDMLIDGLIGMLLCSILAIALSLGISSSLMHQARLDAQQEALTQLRKSIASLGADNICRGVKVPNIVLHNNQSLPVDVECSQSNVAIGSNDSAASVPIYQGTASVTSVQYFGEPGTISVGI